MYKILWEVKEDSELFHAMEVRECAERDNIRTSSFERDLVLRIPQVKKKTKQNSPGRIPSLTTTIYGAIIVCASH